MTSDAAACGPSAFGTGDRCATNMGQILLAAGDLVVGWLLLRQAEVALAALEAGADGKDKDFYTGKVAAAQFFARNVLPRLSAERTIAEATDNSLMDVPESAF